MSHCWKSHAAAHILFSSIFLHRKDFFYTIRLLLYCSNNANPDDRPNFGISSGSTLFVSKLSVSSVQQVKRKIYSAILSNSAYMIHSSIIKYQHAKILYKNMFFLKKASLIIDNVSPQRNSSSS